MKYVYNKLISKLANKLIISFSMLIFLILFMIISVSYVRTTTILRGNYIQDSKKDLRHLSEGMEDYIAQIDALSLTLRTDAQFMNALLYESDHFDSSNLSLMLVL